jgi:death-on-curing protein
MTEYLDLDDLLLIAHGALQEDPMVRDVGLLQSALARTRASAFGRDAYPDLDTKAAALMQSLCANHALVDGNKRLAWAACRVFLGLNGCWLQASEDERFDFVIDVATGNLNDANKIADRLRNWER